MGAMTSTFCKKRPNSDPEFENFKIDIGSLQSSRGRKSMTKRESKAEGNKMRKMYHKAIVYNLQEYDHLMASESTYGKHKQYQWMRGNEVNKKVFEKYYRKFVERKGKNMDEIREMEVAAIVDMFACVQEFKKNIFEGVDWLEYKIGKENSNRKKWERCFLEKVVTSFFQQLQKSDTSFHKLSPNGILSNLETVFKDNFVTFEEKDEGLTTTSVISFILGHIQHRKISDMNFYYVDLFVLSKILKSRGKVGSTTHDLFLENSLSRIFYVLNENLSNKKMFLCVGVSSTGQNRTSVGDGSPLTSESNDAEHDLVKSDSFIKKTVTKTFNLFAKTLTFGYNHAFFVIGGVKIDWVNSEFVHISELGASASARYLFKLSPRKIEVHRTYISSLCVELYYYNCFVAYRHGIQIKGVGKADCQEFVFDLLDYFFKEKFTRYEKGKNFCLTPRMAVEQWKNVLQRSHTAWKPIDEELREGLFNALSEDVMTRKEFIDKEILQEKSFTLKKLQFMFPDRENLEYFLKVCFQVPNLQGFQIELDGSLYKDREALKAIDRGLFLIELAHKKRVKEQGSFLKVSKGSVSETGIQGLHDEKEKEEKMKEEKRFFRRDKSNSTFTAVNPMNAEEGVVLLEEEDGLKVFGKEFKDIPLTSSLK